MLVELLISVALPIVEISLVVTITEVLAETQILIEVLEDSIHTRVVFERGSGHVLSFK